MPRGHPPTDHPTKGARFVRGNDLTLKAVIRGIRDEQPEWAHELIEAEIYHHATEDEVRRRVVDTIVDNPDRAADIIDVEVDRDGDTRKRLIGVVNTSKSRIDE